MVVAASDQPLSVNVISRTPLQPQVKKYASRLFSFDGSVNPIFTGTVFRHWQTDAFLSNDELIVDTDPVGLSVASTVAAEERAVHWWLSECIAFSQAEVASSYSEHQILHVRQGALLTLAVECKGSIESIDVSLHGLPPESWQYISVSADIGSGYYLIDTGDLTIDQSYRVSLLVASKGNKQVTPLVSIVIKAGSGFLPEIRGEDIGELVNHMGSAGDTRLVLVAGEAGVGKTHLIERVAEGLRGKAGFDVLRFTIQDTPDDHLMEAVVRNCLAPPIEKDTFNELTSKIQAELVQQEGGGTLTTDLRPIVRVLSSMGPKVIVLRDCHHITAKLANELWMLISALDDASWGGIRLVLEYRQPDADANGALQELLHKVRLKIRKVLLEHAVVPLDKDMFFGFGRKIFAHVTDELLLSLFRKTGGFPLFLESYLHRLLDLKLIRRRDRGAGFEIVEPARIVTDRLSEGRLTLLEERIKIGFSRIAPDGWRQWAMMIGLIAVSDNTYGQSLIRRALGVSESDCQLLRTILRDLDIASMMPDHQIVFRHDLLRGAMISVASKYPEFKVSAVQVIQVIGANEDFSALENTCVIEADILELLGDEISCEAALRKGLSAARKSEDYGKIVLFLNRLLPLLKDRSDGSERLDLLRQLAWANWVTDSLIVARERYLKLADEAEKNSDGDFSFSEAVATDVMTH